MPTETKHIIFWLCLFAVEISLFGLALWFRRDLSERVVAIVALLSPVLAIPYFLGAGYVMRVLDYCGFYHWHISFALSLFLFFPPTVLFALLLAGLLTATKQRFSWVCLFCLALMPVGILLPLLIALESS